MAFKNSSRAPSKASSKVRGRALLRHHDHIQDLLSYSSRYDAASQNQERRQWLARYLRRAPAAARRSSSEKDRPAAYNNRHHPLGNRNAPRLLESLAAARET